MTVRQAVDVWFRGFLIVALVSLNTRLLADGRSEAILVAMLLSGVWWLNARSVSRIADGAGAACVYAFGAGCGTALGLFVGGL